MRNRTDTSRELLRQFEAIDRGSAPGAPYPDPARFHARFDEHDYRALATVSNEDPIPRPLALSVSGGFRRDRRSAHACLDYLQREGALHAALYDADRTVAALHLDGHLDAAVLDTLLTTLRSQFRLSDDPEREFVLHAAPDRLAPACLDHLAHLGINTLHLQVASDEALSHLKGWLQAARAAGLTTVGATLAPTPAARWTYLSRLDGVLALQPDRLMIHCPGSTADGDKRRAALWRQAAHRLEANGYLHLGSGQHARPGDTWCTAQHRGRLRHTPRGYSALTDCDWIGLGVGTVGRVAEGWYQNARRPLDYCRRLQTGRLPIRRGLHLSADARLRGAVIDTLLCQGSVRYAEFEARHPIVFRNYFRAELTELHSAAHDGLVSLDESGIAVTPLGRWLLPALCRTFARKRSMHDLRLRSV